MHIYKWTLLTDSMVKDIMITRIWDILHAPFEGDVGNLFRVQTDEDSVMLEEEIVETSHFDAFSDRTSLIFEKRLTVFTLFT